MKRSAFLSVALSVGTVSAAFATPNAVVPPMRVDRPGAVRPAGWLLDRACAARDGFTGHLEEIDEHFRIAWTTNAVRRGKLLQWYDQKNGSWNAEGGAYWFDGLVRLAWQLDDPGLKALAKRRLDTVLDNVGTNAIGLIWWLDRNNPEELKEATTFGNWHLNWVLGTAIRPIAAYYEATGDARAKRTLENAYSCLEVVRRCDPAYSPSFVSGAFEALRLTESPLVERCLDAACDRMYAKQYADPPWEHLADTLNFKRVHERHFKLQTRHGVATHENLLSMMALYERRGEDRIKQGLDAWCDFFARHCALPNGLLATDEEWGWAGAYRGTETCVAAAEMHARIQMVALWGEGRRGDEAERAYFNGGAATVSRDFRRHVYCQLPNRTGLGNELVQSSSLSKNATASHYRAKHWPLCCSAALNRILPNYVQGLWMRTSDGGVAAALYGPSTYETTLPVGEVAFTEKTDYPFADEIVLSVDRAPDKAFPLKVRIPGWCDAPSVAVNGETVPAASEKGFATLERVWRQGDAVTLRFPMHVSLRHWQDMNEFGKKRMTVSCGPLTFAYGIPGKDDNTSLGTPREPVLAEDLDASSVTVERHSMPKVWDWPSDAPVRLHLKDASGRPLELVPYGCTKLRVSAFPVAEAAAPRH